MSASMKMIKTIVLILPAILWTILGDPDAAIQPLVKELNLSIDVLSSLIKWKEVQELQQQQKNTAAIASKERMGHSLEWQDARASHHQRPVFPTISHKHSECHGIFPATK